MKMISKYLVVLASLPLALGAQTPINPSSIEFELPESMLNALGPSQFITDVNDEGVQVRNVTSGTNIRSIGQSFVWDNAGDLSGLGILYGSGKTWGETTTQSFELYIYRAEALSGGLGEELGTYSFTLNASLAQAGNWLYFDLPDDLELDEGGVYFFQIAAVAGIQNSSSGDNIAVFARSAAGDDVYGQGRSAQFSSNNVTVPTGVSFDYTFFTLSSIPEPSTYAMIFGGAALVGVCVHRKLKK